MFASLHLDHSGPYRTTYILLPINNEGTQGPGLYVIIDLWSPITSSTSQSYYTPNVELGGKGHLEVPVYSNQNKYLVINLHESIDLLKG